MNRAFLIPALGVLLAVIAAGVLWNAGNSIPRLGQTVVSGIADIGGPFMLTDQNGRLRTEKDFRGRFMLVYFGYTNCPDVCPATLNVMGDALEKLEDRSPRVAGVFITLDPARDTPEALKPYLHAFGRHVIGLTGSLNAGSASSAGIPRLFCKKPSVAPAAPIRSIIPTR